MLINTKFLHDYTDYGLKAYRKEDSEVLSSTFHCGNLCRIYSAPEVLLGNTNIIPAAADVYRWELCWVNCMQTQNCDNIPFTDYIWHNKIDQFYINQ